MSDRIASSSRGPAKNSGSSKKAAAAALLVVLAVLLSWSLGGIGSTSQRIESEHSIVIPRSARHLHCEGLLNGTLLDSGSMATFEIPTAEVDDISRQLAHLQPVAGPGEIPAIGGDKVPGNFGDLLSGTRGWSKAGNTTYLVVYRIDDANRGICLKTIWN